MHHSIEELEREQGQAPRGDHVGPTKAPEILSPESESSLGDSKALEQTPCEEQEGHIDATTDAYSDVRQ